MLSMSEQSVRAHTFDCSMTRAASGLWRLGPPSPPRPTDGMADLQLGCSRHFEAALYSGL